MRWVGLMIVVCVAASARAGELVGFVPGPAFGERVKRVTLESGVRVYVNAPGAMEEGRPTRLVVYATPNGNTIEQTLGRAKGAGIDWHFDIQHVAAQVRRWREVDGRENVVLAVTDAPGKSWPAFRAKTVDAGKVIAEVVAVASAGLPRAAGFRVTLTGHSGGGSFTFGYLNSVEAIPAEVDRITFLDANYSYDDAAGHGDKLMAWLKGDASRHWVVIAYDDREITLDGKKVVGPHGGTFRATGRMVERAKKEVDVAEKSEGPFTTYGAMNGQIRFFVHRNPENKILHTALVGEMNGLLEAMTVGTPEEGKWGTFGGPRAYERWIEVSGSPTAPTTRAAAGVVDPPTIPPRASDAIGGAAFARRIESMPLREREAAIVQEITSGNVPSFLRTLVPIRTQIVGADGARHVAVYFVTPDYLSVGSDEDFFRVPMTPATARAISDAIGCRMVTRKVVDDVYRAAEIKLAPQPLTERREAVETFFAHHRMIEERRAAWGLPATALIAGIKKDVVVSNRLKEKPGRVAIYGWHKTDDSPIQPLTIVHAAEYVDYSHGVRLLGRTVVVDEHPRPAENLLRDAALNGLLSDEGVIGG
jgi:hypothetical protein